MMTHTRSGERCFEGIHDWHGCWLKNGVRYVRVVPMQSIPWHDEQDSRLRRFGSIGAHGAPGYTLCTGDGCKAETMVMAGMR